MSTIPTAPPDDDDNNALSSSSSMTINIPPRSARVARFPRPSTAPAREDVVLLPSIPNDSHYMQTVNEDEDLLSTASGEHSSRSHSTSPLLRILTPRTPLPPGPVSNSSRGTPIYTYDWSTFISAYAAGRWDPHRTPNPPVSSSVWLEPEAVDIADEEQEHFPPEKDSAHDFESTGFTSTPTTPHPLPTKRPSYAKKAPSSNFPLPPHRLRNSFSTSSSTQPPSLATSPVRPNFYIPLASSVNASTPFTAALASPFLASSTSTTNTPVMSSPSSPISTHTAAAALRLAGNNVDIAPLALPSPEHELTDPMRGFHTTIPGSHPENIEYEDDNLVSRKKAKIRSHLNEVVHEADESVSAKADARKRLSARMENLKEFWDGTQDVDPNYGGMTPPIGINDSEESGQDHKIRPSTAPPAAEVEAGDYFSRRITSQSNPSQITYVEYSEHHRPSSTGSMSVPVPPIPSQVDSKLNPRLTRQLSAPLPVSSVGIMSSSAIPSSLLAAGTVAPSPVDTGSVSLANSEPELSPTPVLPILTPATTPGGTLAPQKDEQSYHQCGYLQPPNPPDEMERRRALYKFNIWNTGSDLNFDRIAHLAKLVFHTKCVIISMVDGSEQWFKSEWGLNVSSMPRSRSFCAHAILQRDDEPTVILDTHMDWRFARNPLVTGPLQIRFYAGAPLKTQDGFNVGSLAVLDDAPREDFTPRQRHTLKEFAAIAMREMELWRDKIQLRIRDRIQTSMEQFSRECLENDMDEPSPPDIKSDGTPNRSSMPTALAQSHRPPSDPNSSRTSSPSLLVTSMDKIYSRAARLIQRTLDVEDVVVMDVSHCEVFEPAPSLPLNSGSLSTSGGNPSLISSFAGGLEGTVSVTMYYGDPAKENQSKTLSVDDFILLSQFFHKYPNGKVFEGVVPLSFRVFLPTRMNYALTVPIFNIDKRPFALLCAYNSSDHAKRYLEGHELSYLRAIGVIILSAILKRRMILADKAKSLFISNISHELRTPLHGILAAAELLAETSLNHSQASFLQTVQACGTSLDETVNHVLDFTKLSGNSKSGGVENAIARSTVDLMLLIENAIDGCWIGHQARTSAMAYPSGIGSVYSPPNEEGSPIATTVKASRVEAVIDIGHRVEGWQLKCEKGGIGRILMNVFGNSLKFTNDGFIHVILRQLPPSEKDPINSVKLELAVLDTGKGISQSFLKNELFHPFSQENPLQTGTGLGLAIVNSIVQSESVNGKIDVWSEENIGTEIKVTFEAQIPEDANQNCGDTEPFRFDDPINPVTISLLGFDSDHRGTQLLRSVLQTYLVTWWGFTIDPQGAGKIVILNETVDPVMNATEKRDTSRLFIILSSSRGSPSLLTIASEHELIGGFCRILYKPGGPSRLRAVLKLCVHALKIGAKSQSATPIHKAPPSELTEGPHAMEALLSGLSQTPPRRNSDNHGHHPPRRPLMSPRSTTAHPMAPPWKPLASTSEADEPDLSVDPAMPTIAVGTSGTLLQASVGTLQTQERRCRILVVEDNSILRSLLVKWLSNKGYDFRQAVDGQDGVTVFEQEGPFDVVLLDLSMPILDGIGATAQIRQIEANLNVQQRTRILALTGMSSLDDKRRAFEAGVDGYLVKPVAFKTLDEMFKKLGLS